MALSHSGTKIFFTTSLAAAEIINDASFLNFIQLFFPRRSGTRASKHRFRRIRQFVRIREQLALIAKRKEAALHTSLYEKMS